MWSQLHDQLSASNLQKLAENVRRICLTFQLCCQALDLCKGISDDVTTSEKGAQAAVDAVYKRDAFSVLSEV